MSKFQMARCFICSELRRLHVPTLYSALTYGLGSDLGFGKGTGRYTILEGGRWGRDGTLMTEARLVLAFGFAPP